MSDATIGEICRTERSDTGNGIDAEITLPLNLPKWIGVIDTKAVLEAAGETIYTDEVDACRREDGTCESYQRPG